MIKLNNIILIVFLLFFSLIFYVMAAFAQRQVIDIYFFMSDTCPFCKKMGELIEQSQKENPELQVYKYEVTKDEKGRKLLAELAKVYQINITGLPVVFIGEEVISGFDREKFVGALAFCKQNGCTSPADKIDPATLKSILETDNNGAGGLVNNHRYIGWIIGIGIAVLIIFAFIFAAVRKGPGEDPSMQS